jgi:RNA polymerase sigma factor (sigma-70 family)
MIQLLRLLRAAAGSDRDLLDRYARDRDQEAFEALVRRYGTGVWAACVRLAGRDAEDAFQAVFLILSRKAGTVTGSLPAWLHAVTRRVAANLRRNARRRSEVEAAARPPEPVAADVGLSEGLAVLDEELSRLPERYRAVLIVCCLEGRSRDEAAAQLGWSEGQVKGRLERAREMLRARLARRGVELGGVLLAAAVCRPAPALTQPSPAVRSLANGVANAMTLQKLRVLVAVLVLAAGAVAYHTGGAVADPPVKTGWAPVAGGDVPKPDDGSDILRTCLAKSDLVVLGELTTVTIAPNTAAGFGTYLCTVRVEEVIKGKPPEGGLKARLSRFEMAEGDKHPDLKKGGRCILFLKVGNDPWYTLADYWFGVQRPSPSMAGELKRLVAQRKAIGPMPGDKSATQPDQRKQLVDVQGLTAEQVLRRLGNPDEVRRIPASGLLDGVRYGTKEAPEVERWAYGTAGKGTFARVGFVGFDRDGRVVVAMSPDGFSDPAYKLPELVPARTDRAVETPSKMRCHVGPVEYIPARGLTPERLKTTVTVKNAGPGAFELKHDAATSVRRFLLVELYDAAGVLLFREDQMRYHSPFSPDPARWPVLAIPAGREQSEELVISPASGFGALPAGKYALRVYFPFEEWRYYPSNLVGFELEERPKE